MTKLSDGPDCLARPIVPTSAIGEGKHQRSPVVHSRCYSCQRKVVTSRGDYTQCQVCGMKEGDSDVKEIRTLTFCEVCLNNETMRQALFNSLCEIPTAINTCYFDSYTDGVLKIYACQRQDGCWNKIRRSKALTVLRTPPEKRAPSKKKPKNSDAGDESAEDSPVSPKVSTPKKGKVKKVKASKAASTAAAAAVAFDNTSGLNVDIPSPRDTIMMKDEKDDVEGGSPIPSYSYESEGTLYTPYSSSPIPNEQNLESLGMWSPVEPVGPPMELFNIWNEPASLDEVTPVLSSAGDRVEDNVALEPLDNPWL